MGRSEKMMSVSAFVLLAGFVLILPNIAIGASVEENIITLTDTNSCSGCDLHGANLSGAILNDADLSGANLEGANLEDAYLDTADLSDASLKDASLKGADLTNAKVKGANFVGAKGLTPEQKEGLRKGGAKVD